MAISGKRVVITGASSGIGLHILRNLLEEECKVVAASRRIENIPFSHEQLFLKRCDVSDPNQVDQLFSFACETLGNIDIFIANAGFAYYEQYQSGDWEHIKHIIDTNVSSICYSAGKMIELSGDVPFSFVCTASAMSYISLPGYALYCATKAAVNGFLESLRLELKEGQLIQAAYPVATETEFFSTAGSRHKPWPVQKADKVARSIIKGIDRGSVRIYTSKLFQVALKVFPFLLRGYIALERRKFTASMQQKEKQF